MPILRLNASRIKDEGRTVTVEEEHGLAVRDGFSNRYEIHQWFWKEHPELSMATIFQVIR